MSICLNDLDYRIHIKYKNINNNKLNEREEGTMTESDQHTNDKELMSDIKKKLRNKFNIRTEYIGDGKLGIEEFNGYIDSEEHYEDIESLGDSICNWLRIKFDNDFDYSLLESGYELTIQVI